MENPINGIGARSVDVASLASAARVDTARARAQSDPAQAAKMFEDLLATTLVREMRRGLQDGFFGGAPGADVYEGWLDEHIGRSLAQSGAFDIAQAVRISLGDKLAHQTQATETPR